MQRDQHVGCGQRVGRTLAGADRLNPNPMPARHLVDAHLIDIGAEIGGCGKRRFDVAAPRRQVAQQRDRFAFLDVAELEFLAKQAGELRVVDQLGSHAKVLPKG